MKRPLLTVGVAFAVGTWAPFYFAGLGPLPASGACVALALAAALFKKWGRAIPVALLAFALGLASFHLYRQRQIMPLALAAGETVELQGVVTDAQVRLPSYILTVRATFPGSSLPDTTLRIRSYGEEAFAPGEGIAATVQLEELQSSRSYYNAQGIFSSARLLEAERAQELTIAQKADTFFLNLNARMTANLYGNLPQDTAELMAAMVLGDRSGLAQEVTWALAKAGTVHIVSVSGLHLSVLVGCVVALLERLRLRKLPVSLGGGLTALAFAFLVGFSPSVTRALVMMLVVLAGKAVSRRSDTLNSLGLAVLLIAIFAPHWTLSGGLWLSASSTAGIALLAGPIQKRIMARYENTGKPTRLLAKLFWGAAAVSVSAYIVSFPVLLVTYGWVSLISPVANLLITPLVTPALLCGMLCAIFSAAPGPIAWLARVCSGLVVSLSRLLSGLPFATFAIDEGWKPVWLLLAAAVILLLARWKWPRPLMAYAAALLVFTFALGTTTLNLNSRDQVEVIALEGCSPTLLLRQGSAVLVGTPNVYEIGGLLRYLDWRGIAKLDAVIAYDCGEQIPTGLTRLAAETAPAMILGPDDAYILGQMSRALPGFEILSSGYAKIDVLGGVMIAPHLTGGGADILAGDCRVAKTAKEYGIIKLSGDVGIWADGAVLWSPATPPAPEFMGALLFGERRIILDL